MAKYDFKPLITGITFTSEFRRKEKIGKQPLERKTIVRKGKARIRGLTSGTHSPKAKGPDGTNKIRTFFLYGKQSLEVDCFYSGPSFFISGREDRVNSSNSTKKLLKN